MSAFEKPKIRFEDIKPIEPTKRLILELTEEEVQTLECALRNGCFCDSAIPEIRKKMEWLCIPILNTLRPPITDRS